MAITVPIITQFDSKAIKLAERRFKQFGREASSVGDSVKKAMLPAAAAVGALAAAGFSAVKSASDLNESVNAVGVTFGETSAEILKLSDAAAKSVGLSKKDFNSLAVQFSSFATKIAGKGGNVAKVIEKITGRAADFASVFNIDVADAAAKFQSGLAGEAEPLKKFGIDLSDVSIKAFAAANKIGTLGKSGAKLTEAEKVLARYGSLMEQTDKNAGDFLNTSDSLANQQKILKAEFENVKGEIGMKLLPVFQKVAQYINDRFIPYMKTLADTFNEHGLSGVVKQASTDLGNFIKELDGWQGTLFDFAAAVGVLTIAIKGLLVANAAAGAMSALAGALTAVGGILGGGFAITAGLVATAFVSILGTVMALIGLLRSEQKPAFIEYLKNTAKLIANAFILIHNTVIDTINLLPKLANIVLPGSPVGKVGGKIDYFDYSYGAGDFQFGSSPAGLRMADQAKTQIIIQTGIGDPAAIGREVQKVLDAQSRRSGGK
jgi:hypothetical protein